MGERVVLNTNWVPCISRAFQNRRHSRGRTAGNIVHHTLLSQESNCLEEISRAQGHSSESACVFETAFENFDSVITPTIFLAFWLVLWARINFRKQKWRETVCYVQLLDGHPWWTMIGMHWWKQWTENCKMHSKYSMLDLGLKDCLLEDFVLQRRLHLQWTPGPLLRVNGIPTKGGRWILV